jgi:GntR family uxuAB operon transcriptional repressor
MGYPARPSAPVPAQLTHQLAELILAESARAGLGPGSRLPTERQLAADLGATRTSVRHALAMLEAEGRISREVGRGTFLRQSPAQQAPGAGSAPLAPFRPAGAVAGPDDGVAGRRYLDQAGALRLAADAGRAAKLAGARPPAEGSAGFAPADVMTIRRLLEPLAMPLVVAWATAADFREMDRCLAGGSRAGSYDEFETWDLALHRSIMAASHSPLLAELYAVIERARHGQSWGDMKRRSASRERRDKYQADHTELVAGLRARDSDRATEAMRTHLSRVHSDLFGETA